VPESTLASRELAGAAVPQLGQAVVMVLLPRGVGSLFTPPTPLNGPEAAAKGGERDRAPSGQP
jgi:hypothetical protein